MNGCITCFCLGVGFTEEQESFFRGKDHMCDRATEDGVCNTYINPSMWWRKGWSCPMASHYKPFLLPEKKKKRVGQQKQTTRR